MTRAGPALRLRRTGRPGSREAARAAALSIALVCAGPAAGCGGERLALPPEGELAGTYGPDAEVSLNGNVVDVRVVQPAEQLARGGPVWAKVGPYIYLFSPQTRELLERWSGVGGVRVRTFPPRGETPVAEALLARDELTRATWPRAIRLAGRARLEGTERPSYMIDLVRYGEEHTTFEYDPRYAGGGP